jgi:hypothetical protein
MEVIKIALHDYFATLKRCVHPDTYEHKITHI